jgi:Peptidase family M23
MPPTPELTRNGVRRWRIRHHPTHDAAPADRPERNRARRLVLSLAAALVALVASFALGALGIPFGLLVAGLLLAWPAGQVRTISPSRRTRVAGVIAVASYVALLLLFGPLIFRGLVNNQLPAALAALAVLAATPMICAIVMSDAPTEPTRRLVLTRRDLVLAVAVLVAVTFAHCSGASFVVIAVLVLVLPIIGVVRFALDAVRKRLETRLVRHPFRSDLRFHLLQVLNIWLLCALLAVIPLTGAFDALGYRGGAATVFSSLYWAALGVLALLALLRVWGTAARPAAGRVSQVVDDQPDQAIGQSDIEHPAGNLVVIDIGSGRYVMMAHFRPGSIRVRVGETVRAGQQLGSVGNSGNTSEPHLHIQVQNRPTLDFPKVDDIDTTPIVFAHAVVTRAGTTTTPARADLRRGDDFSARR